MFSYDFVDFHKVTSKKTVDEKTSQMVSKIYGIRSEDVLKKIHERDSLGSTEIDPGFYLPHIEYHKDKQGLILTHYQIDGVSLVAMFLIMNATQVDQELSQFLQNILNPQGLESLRTCESLGDLKEIIEEGKNV
jgi:Phosphotransferase system mannitol/fructose-specific IIA domain (Ntr-type)